MAKAAQSQRKLQQSSTIAKPITPKKLLNQRGSYVKTAQSQRKLK
jgi:hypothetical protein